MTQNDAQVVRLEFTLQYEDLREARKLTAKVLTQMKKKEGGAGSLWAWVALLFLCIGISVIFHQPAVSKGVVRTAEPTGIGRLMTGGSMGAILFIGVVGYLWWNGTGKRAWKNAMPPEAVAVEMSRHGIIYQTATSKTENTWMHFEQAQEGKTVLVLFHREALAAILPKRVMTEEQALKIRGLMLANIGKAKGFEVVMEGRPGITNADGAGVTMGLL